MEIDKNTNVENLLNIIETLIDLANFKQEEIAVLVSELILRYLK